MSKILDDSGNLRPEFEAEIRKIIDVERLNSLLLELSVLDIFAACMELVGIINLSLCESVLLKRYRNV